MAREALAAAYWKMGDLARAGELLSSTAYAELGIEGFKLAVDCGEAGDLDAAFEHLQRLIDARDPALIHLAVAPQWDSLRADPRFNECLARMKLRPVLGFSTHVRDRLSGGEAARESRCVRWPGDLPRTKLPFARAVSSVVGYSPINL